jgi:hypothetical protein
MTHKKYHTAIDNALKYAGGGPEWNARFELHLLKNGLKIVDKQPPKNINGNDFMAPVPVSGERHQYPYPSWIVEL